MASAALRLKTDKNLAPLVSAALFAAGAEGLEERRVRGAVELVTYGQSDRELTKLWRRCHKKLGVLALGLEPQIEVQADESWKSSWTEALGPVQLTPRLVLAPVTALPGKLERGQKLITYQPALAFGDGDHATTRLAARAIERHYRKQPGGALLDIGAGTGVLSLVAVLSGAGRALGTDIAPEAVQAARRNAVMNDVAKQVRFVSNKARVSGGFDLVVVNIELRPLLEVLATLPAAAKRAPRLLVTGFLSSQREQVTRALDAVGLRVQKAETEGDWVLLSASPR